MSTRPRSLPAPNPVLPRPTDAQLRVLDRIAQQRERIHARRAARAQSAALAQRAKTDGTAPSLPEEAIQFVKAHPAAVVGVVGLALMAGPRRLIRWAGVALPWIIRMRS